MDIGGNGGQAQRGTSSVSYRHNFLVMPRHKKVVGYYVIPSEILSVCPSVRQRFIICVRSINLIPFEII